MVSSIRLRDVLLFTTATPAFAATHLASDMSIAGSEIVASQADDRNSGSGPKFVAGHIGNAGGGSPPKFDDVTTVGLTTVTVFGSNSLGIIAIDSTTSAVPEVATSASVAEVTLATANATDAIPSNFTTNTVPANTSVSLSWTTEPPTGTGVAEGTTGGPAASSSKNTGVAEVSSPFEWSAKAIIMAFLVALAL